MAAPHSSPPRSPPSTLRSPPPPAGPKESAVSRLLIAPLTFISFLLSLALVDSHNNALRARSHIHSHSPSRPAPTTTYGRVKNFMHGLCYKPTSSPYAYVRSPVLKPVGSVIEKERSGVKQKGEDDERWFWHTKQKKMMKAELSDAFRIRKWVVAALGIGVVGLLFVGAVFVNWVVSISRYYWLHRADLGYAVREAEGDSGNGVLGLLAGSRLWRDW